MGALDNYFDHTTGYTRRLLAMSSYLSLCYPLFQWHFFWSAAFCVLACKEDSREEELFLWYGDVCRNLLTRVRCPGNR
jgi:hypothetical protein